MKKRGSTPVPNRTIKRIPFRLPKHLKRQLQRSMVDDGYGLKGKSRWIIEAIESLFTDPSWLSQVLDGDIIEGHEATEDAYLPIEIYEKTERHLKALVIVTYSADFNEQGHVEPNKVPELVSGFVDPNLDYRTVKTPTLPSIIRAAIARRVGALGLGDIEKSSD